VICYRALPAPQRDLMRCKLASTTLQVALRLSGWAAQASSQLKLPLVFRDVTRPWVPASYISNSHGHSCYCNPTSQLGFRHLSDSPTSAVNNGWFTTSGGDVSMIDIR